MNDPGCLFRSWVSLRPARDLRRRLPAAPGFALKERQLATEASLVAEKAAQYAAQTERLEQRVRVLERIVTDRGQDLAGEIENLRDRPSRC